MDNAKIKHSKFKWLWDNIEGLRFLYVIAMLGTVVYNIMQLTVPYYSSRIVDRYLSGPDAVNNLQNDRKGFYVLIALMIGLTFIRVIVVYFDCMML